MNSLNFRCQDRLISAFFKDVSAVFSDAEIYELKKIISRPFIFPRDKRLLLERISENCEEARRLSDSFGFKYLSNLLALRVKLLYRFKQPREEENVLIGDKYSVGLRFLEVIEQSNQKFLWISQNGPFSYDTDYPLTVAQAEFHAPVIPCSVTASECFEKLEQFSLNWSSQLTVLEIGSGSQSNSLPGKSLNFFPQLLNKLSFIKFQGVIIHLDEEIEDVMISNRYEIVSELQKLKAIGKDVYFGCDQVAKEEASQSFVAAVKGVL